MILFHKYIRVIRIDLADRYNGANFIVYAFYWWKIDTSE